MDNTYGHYYHIFFIYSLFWVSAHLYHLRRGFLFCLVANDIYDHNFAYYFAPDEIYRKRYVNCLGCHPIVRMILDDLILHPLACVVL